MKQTELIMGMPITAEIVNSDNQAILANVFDYFRAVDARFSTYKPASEMTKVNAGLPRSQWSSDMKTVMRLCQQTKRQTGGYFDIEHNDALDPSGLVKGWAVQNAASMLRNRGVKNFYIEAGGDIQVSGNSATGRPWVVGIRNPFNVDEIIKTIAVTNGGVATSGTYIREQHIYNPFASNGSIEGVKSLTVVGPNIYDADRFATAAFAMGRPGIHFIDALPGFEGYMVDDQKQATLTKGFERYVQVEVN